MRFFSTIFSFLAIVIIIVGLLAVSPFVGYYAVINNFFEVPYYKLKKLPTHYLSPKNIKKHELIDEQTAYRERWKVFHIKDIKIPLPSRNPLYQVVPILKHHEDRKPELGLKFVDPQGNEFSRIYFLENNLFEYELGTQELFKIPLIEKTLLEIPLEKIWRDLFQKNLYAIPTSYGEVAYNLYLLQLRMSLFPPNIDGFAPMSNPKMGVILLRGLNKDFNTELVMINENGLVYSYILASRKDNEEADKARNYFFERIDFERGSQEVSNIIYKEFKSLDFQDQIHQEGMLYLLSAWSHWMDNREFFRLMVELSERSQKNDLILPELYKFSLTHFGTTFSTKQGLHTAGDPEVELKRNIELEKQRQLREATQENSQKIEKRPTQKQELNYELQKAKEARSKNKTKKIRVN